MKLKFPKNHRNCRLLFLAGTCNSGSTASPSPGGEGRGEGGLSIISYSKFQNGFTMMEIAISLAIIGIALVAIIGVLPIGMNAQQDNRQETIIGEDANVLIEDIRNGALGANDLTNYIYAITNYWTQVDATGKPIATNYNAYTFSSSLVTYPPPLSAPANSVRLNNGADVIGVLSTPEFTDWNGNPTANIYTSAYYSNHVVAYVYSISGPAVEKPPQDNQLMQQDSFGYRVYVVNTPQAVNTNLFWEKANSDPYADQLNAAIHELRLTFEWPQLPNGTLGSGRQTFRTLIAGRLLFQPQFFNGSIPLDTNLYVYQSQSFTNSP